MADKFYNFSGVSYATQEQLLAVFRNHDVLKALVALHDNDILADGTVKKPHVHFVICCKSNHTVSAVRKWCKGLSVDDVEQNTLAQPCESLIGASRYLLHLDSPDKVLYSVEHVKVLNDASRRMLQDAVNGDYGEERQFEVVLAYANHEITLVQAMRQAPELFIHKYVSIQKLVRDLRGRFEDEN